MLTLYDDKHSSDEDRWITMGISSTGRLLVVCRASSDNMSGPRSLECRRVVASLPLFGQPLSVVDLG